MIRCCGSLVYLSHSFVAVPLSRDVYATSTTSRVYLYIQWPLLVRL